MLAVPCPDHADPELWHLLGELPAHNVVDEAEFLAKLCARFPMPADQKRLADVRAFMAAHGLKEEQEEPAQPVECPAPALAPPPVEKPVQKQQMPNVTLYTDGSNLGSPGPGGWGALLVMGGKERELSGQIESATNNIAELMGVIGGLRVLRKPCSVKVVSDSKYVVEGIRKTAYRAAHGWKKATGGEIANLELWQEVWRLMQRHTVTAKWVKGHNGHPENERVDKLAGAASRAEKKRQESLNHA